MHHSTAGYFDIVLSTYVLIEDISAISSPALALRPCATQVRSCRVCLISVTVCLKPQTPANCMPRHTSFTSDRE